MNMQSPTKGPTSNEHNPQGLSEQSRKEIRIGQYLLDRLYSLGVEHVFGLPGDYVIRFDKLIEQHAIRFINTTRENTAGYMADAYARVRGLGVACITYGVGVNIVNAMSQAYVENSPIVIISGAAGTEELVKSPHLHHLINTSSNARADQTQLEIFKHVTVDQAVLNDPSKAIQQIDSVLAACLFYKKPVYIEIPRNMVEKNTYLSEYPPSALPISNRQALMEALKEVDTILHQCKRPVIWVGRDVQSYQVAPLILQFAEKYRIPIVSTLLGKSVIDERHPLFVGVYTGGMSRPEVKDFVESCDCILTIGVIMSDVDTGIFTAKLEDLRKVVVDSQSISIDHHHYRQVLLFDFLRELENLEMRKTFSDPFPRNGDRMIDFHPTSAKITTSKVFECLQTHLTQEHLIITDVGDCLFGSADLILAQNSFIACAYFATLGFGVPGAISAQIADPTRRVIGIVGDGACQMTITELSTAVRYHIDPIIIILNNHGYGTERPLLEGDFNDIQNWNYAELPHILNGGRGIKVKTEQEYDQALSEAMSSRGEFWIVEVELDKTDFSPALRRFGALMGKQI